MKWESGAVHVALEDALRPATAEGESALKVAKDWLTEILKNSVIPSKDVEEAAKKAGLSWATVRRAADDLRIKKTREGFGSDGHWMWSLP